MLGQSGKTAGSFIREMDSMNDELRQILQSSLFGTLGAMWVVGGFAIVWGRFAEHWAPGWFSLFVWV